MSVTSVLNRLDELVVKTEIADLSELANGLLEKAPKGRGKDIKDVTASGHRRYPHLVPMYRTVHRTIPRAMVFRAIRWVNPKRMFPGAGLTKEEMQKMSPSELQELAVKLNTYREEAHVIHNRYNQMIDLIERGQTPYFIPYANIQEPRWLLLEGYMARAERLKNGTMAWERTLDQQAQDLRSVLLQEDKGKVKFDDIDGLWTDPNGKARAPMFMDVKQKKGVPLRRQRTVNGERLKGVEPQAFARLFIGVAPGEVRRGEVVRMPHAGNYVNPAWIGNREKRILARNMGDAAMHLARIPKAPIQIAQVQRKEFAERGQLLTIPAGRAKNPVFIVFDSVPAEEVANRRWQRVTQPERGGRHATGAPMSGPEGVHRAPRPAAVQAFPRVRPPARQSPSPPAPPPPVEPLRSSEIARKDEEEKVKIRDRQQGLGSERIRDGLKRQNANRDNLLKQWNQPLNILGDGVDPTQQNPEAAGFTNGRLKGKPTPGHGGMRSRVNFTVTVGGKAYIYKVHHEDSRGELMSFMMDRATGGGAMPAIHTHQYSATAMKTAFDSAHGNGALSDQYEPAAKQARLGGGHLMEFCAECVEPLDAGDIMKEMMKTKEGRNEFNKLTMIDFLTSNGDRHQGNWYIHPDGKMIAIDNAYSVWEDYGDPDVERVMTLGAPPHAGMKAGELRRGVPSENWSGVTDVSGAKIDKTMLTEEAGEFFDEHFDIDKIQAGAAAVNVRFEDRFSPQDIQRLRAQFISVSQMNFRNQLQNLGR